MFGGSMTYSLPVKVGTAAFDMIFAGSKSKDRGSVRFVIISEFAAQLDKRIGHGRTDKWYDGTGIDMLRRNYPHRHSHVQ